MRILRSILGTTDTAYAQLTTDNNTEFRYRIVDAEGGIWNNAQNFNVVLSGNL